MTRFRYKAATAAGDLLEGEMEAASQELVIRQLQSQGHLPIRAEEVVARATPRINRHRLLRPRRVSRQDIHLITLELSTLLQSGLTLDKTLAILIDLAEHDALRKLLSDIHKAVRGGASLSAALEAQQGTLFSHFYLNMVRAGESSGALDIALGRLAEFMERSRKLRETLVSALIYPAILAAMAALSVIVLLTFVIPRFTEMFQDLGQELPWPTQVVIGVGGFLESYWWIIALVATAGSYYLRYQLRSPSRRLPWDARFLRLPLVGTLIAQHEAARFTRTLGTLLTNGVPMLQAMLIAKEVIGNQVIAGAVERIKSSVKEGQGLARALAAVQVFPRLTGHLLQVGEETGNLEAMLLRLADIYERDVQTAVQRLVVLIEPALILSLGLVVGGIIMSVLMAVLSVNDLGL
nr:type II secretion system F family protein [Gammaproteobacteria bacterium]